MQVIGCRFQGRGQQGDFSWMIEQPDYRATLFIFNDNEEQFLQHHRDPNDSGGCAAGGGNAVIRPYQCHEPPRAAGVPTGTLHGGGYTALTPHAKAMIDEAIGAIRTLVASGGYQQVIYSAANEQGELGTGIFAVAEEVKKYIVEQLRSLTRVD